MVKKTERNYFLLSIVFIVSLLIANIIAPKLMYLPFKLFTEEKVLIPIAVFVYSITFLLADVVGEIWGKKEAGQLVMYGFFAQIVASIFILFGFILPAAFEDTQTAYSTMLGMNWLIVLGSLSAYLLSQWLDIHVFHYLKAKTESKYKWLRNTVSTILSQIIDTSVFLAIAFGLSNIIGFNIALVEMIIAHIIVKILLAILEMPIFYLLTGRSLNIFKKKEAEK